MEGVHPWEKENSIKRDSGRLFLVIIGAIIMGLNLNSFVYFGELIPEDLWELQF